MANWIKKTSYGDYTNPLQNHKFDGQLILDAEGKCSSIFNKLHHILHHAKYFYGKHIGSKKLVNVKNAIRRASMYAAKMKELNSTDNNDSSTNNK